MLGAAIMLVTFGILGVIIGMIMNGYYERKGDFSWLPIIFCGTGLILFAVAIVLNDCIHIRLLHL